VSRLIFNNLGTVIKGLIEGMTYGGDIALKNGKKKNNRLERKWNL